MKLSRSGWWLRVFSSTLLVLLPGLGHAATTTATNPAIRPEVKSASALIVDATSGEVLFERQPKLVTPIASITKLMTALVVLDALQPLDEVITIKGADRWKGKGAFSHIPNGAKLTRSELMHLALMASENLAARVLATNYPGGLSAFVHTMNVKAKALGMTQTHFDDPSGLSSANVSTAHDLVKLINAASRQSVIRDYSTSPSYEVRLAKRPFVYRNTNLLIGKQDWDIAVQKTGFTNDAGQCLLMQTTIDGRRVNMVFLNSFGSLTRTADARRIRRWMEAQNVPVVVSAGAVGTK